MDNQTLVQVVAGVISLTGTFFTGFMAYKTLRANQSYEAQQRNSRRKNVFDLKDREAIFRLQEEMRNEYKTTIAELRERIEELQKEVASIKEEKFILQAELTALKQKQGQGNQWLTSD